MKLWWLADFTRVGAERAAVEALVADGWFTLSGWRVDAYRLAAEGVITARGVAYPVRLLYPDQFPSVPAWVEPQDATVRWSEHQYGAGGVLCLELRPDNWSPSASGAEVLRSAYHLLLKENPLGEGSGERVLSAHQIGEVQAYEWGPYPVLIGAACLARIEAGVAEDVRAVRWLVQDADVWPILVSDAADRRHPRHPPGSDLGTLRFEVPVVVARTDGPEPEVPDRASLADALGVDLDPERYAGAVVVVVVSGGRVTPFHSPDAASVFVRRWVVLPEDVGVRSGRAEAAIPKRAAIVGLGSVGSKVAEMLLRSGIHHLVLVDGDVLLPANLERHTLDWRDVGFRKVHAVTRRLLQVVPGAEIQVIAANLDWQRSARTHAEQVGAVAGCDLIVDATGDVPTALFLGAIAAENGRAFVSVEVFEGGLGALIARAVPGRDAAYGLARTRYNAYCDVRDVAPPPSGRRSYEALSATGEPFVADDAAVTLAAAHGARVALDVLDERLGPADAAWLLVGFRAGWLFARHGDTIALDVGGPLAPADAGEDGAAHADVHTDAHADGRAFAVALAQEVLDAAAAAG